MPTLDLQSLEFISRSAEQTRRAGFRLGSLLQPGDMIALIGDLGAGKTTLVQGISAGWGSLDAVSSPTFVLVNVYRKPDGSRLYHLDAYRLSSALEAEDLDLDALLENGPLIVEWADRIQEILPADRLWITLKWVDESGEISRGNISTPEEQRDMILSASGPRYQAMLREFKRHIFGVA
jgi:tRNA threonylcarbamoyladenosine biosynthesis protein TsaE